MFSNLRKVGILLLLVLMIIPGAVVLAEEPTYASATVDGDPGEWDLTADFFADMYWGGRPDLHPEILSRLYLRYDCLAADAPVLYGLVLANTDEATLQYDTDSATQVHFMQLRPAELLVTENDGDDGTPPDFAYVNISGSVADGWEASAYVDPGTYNLDVLATTSDGKRSRVEDKSISLTLDCGVTAISLNTATANGTGNPTIIPIALLVGTLLVATVVVVRSRRSPAS